MKEQRIGTQLKDEKLPAPPHLRDALPANAPLECGGRGRVNVTRPADERALDGTVDARGAQLAHTGFNLGEFGHFLFVSSMRSGDAGCGLELPGQDLNLEPIG